MTAGVDRLPDLFVDDAALVRAPRWLVDERLADVAGWPRWWPGLGILSSDGGAHHLRASTVRPWRPRHHLRLAVRPWGRRPGLGVHVAVTGDVVAAVEFWLEDADTGTLVHHLAHVDASSRAAPRWRPLVRAGLWALDDRLVPEVRQAVLPAPGTT